MAPSQGPEHQFHAIATPNKSGVVRLVAVPILEQARHMDSTLVPNRIGAHHWLPRSNFTPGRCRHQLTQTMDSRSVVARQSR